MLQGSEANVGAAQKVQIGSGVAGVRATTDFDRKRYRENRNWQLVPKEFIYHHLVEAGVRGKHVLDFGCGTGEVTTQIAMLGAHVTGLDVLDELMDVARRQAELDGVGALCTFVTGAIETVGFPDGMFDFIVCNAVLHHVDLTVTMPALMAALKPGGMLLVLEPIAFSSALQTLRDNTPVTKGDLDPEERQLTPADIDYVKSYITVTAVRHFRLFERLTRVIPALWRPLISFDRAVMAVLPFLARYSGTIVVIGRKLAA